MPEDKKADEFDRRIMPDFMQTTFAMSLGAAYRGCEMIRKPAESLSKLANETKEMFTVPEDAGTGLQDKLQALAGVWMEKGVTVVTDLKTTGEKFSEGK